MTQNERLSFMLEILLAENSEYSDIKIPKNIYEQKKLLRALMNIRPPKPIDKEFLHIQDDYLQFEIMEKGVTSITDIKPIQENIFLWQGDITTLEVDAIVNAANSKMLGCFVTKHACIDNAIHTYAGVQLRLECAKIMIEQREDEQTGSAKITSAYNLPSQYVLHTVGPIVSKKLTEKNINELENCYTACLKLADEKSIKSIAFCCISTGEFHFPNHEAAQIAISTVKKYLLKTQSKMKVIFNVFKEEDYNIYRELLRTN